MASSTVPRRMRSGLSERTTSPFEVWAAPSPCGLGSRSIARAEGPARPSPAARVSGLTADDRCRGSLRLAVAHHFGRRRCGWLSRLPAREHNGSRRSHRTDHSCGSVHRSHWRPSTLAHASEQSSLKLGPHRTGHANFNLCSPPPSYGGSSRLPARAIVIAPRGRHGLTILSTTLQDNSGCPSWQHTSKGACSLGPSRTRHANLSVQCPLQPGPCFCPALTSKGCAMMGVRKARPSSLTARARFSGHRDCRGLTGPLVLG
jgi:hypothetical protein